MAQLAARRSHNPKVASSILAGSNSFFIFLYTVRVFLCRVVREFSAGSAFGWMAERSKALV